MQRARTDLAVEARSEYMEKYAPAHSGEIDGVVYSERKHGDIDVSEIDVTNEAGERAVGRRMGKYVSLCFPDITVTDFEGFARICEACAGELMSVCKTLAAAPKSLLVCGIGNAKMTPDALGPQALSHVLVTRSLREREPEIFKRSGFFDICAIAPGVGADTGLDAAEIVRAAAEIARPDIVVAIDALAARSAERLCKTVQICSAGISPGSGVGNAVRAIDKESIGVPVVALGVPTVIDAGTLVRDACGREESGYDGFFVCPKEIDAQTEKLSRLLGFAVNRAFHGLDLREML
ncbi:MAG: GPR endopeptidase [Clostridia bacterium]|nr:GPR endopeptidase [Clostridia bacterium]